MGDQSHQWRAAASRGGVGQPRLSGARARALLLVEIADFPRLRRDLGVARAELLALNVAERVAAVLPDAVVATVGRDLVELEISVVDRGELDLIVARLHRDAEKPLVVSGKSIPLQLCIGAALSTDPDEVALAEAAEAGLAAARTVDATPSAVVPGEQGLSEDLHAAARRGELFLQYQPKLHLRRQEVTGVEALIRWRHPRRGLVMPGDFIAAAERCGAIKAMTLWTLRQVIADQHVLARNGHDLPVSINMAGVLLSDKAFVAEVCELVRDCGASLGFEITETSVIREPDLAIEHLRRFADTGVAISIDDYGAGLSSLAYLKQLPAGELKIDKLFVTQLSSSHRDPLIVRSTIDLAHALEMEVVAEGVETPASLALLTVMGCDMVQGFLISRPLALEALLAFLRDRPFLALPSQPSHFERLAAVRARG